MNCQEMNKRIEAYLEGSLDDGDRQELENHLETCPTCRQEFEDGRKLETVIREAFTFSCEASLATEAVLSKTTTVTPRPAVRFEFGKIAAGLLLLAGLAIGFYAGRQSAKEPAITAAATAYRISELEGTVLVRHPNATAWRPLTAEAAIYTGDELLSLPGGRARLEVAADSFVELFENSMLVVEVTGDRTDLRLVRGRLDADLDSPHGPFFVTTPHGRAEALGTEFTVTVE